MLDALEGETRDGVLDSADRVNAQGFRGAKDDDDERGAAEKTPGQIDLCLENGNEFGADEKIKNRATNEQQPVCDKPEFVFRFCFDFLDRLRVAGTRPILSR